MADLGSPIAYLALDIFCFLATVLGAHQVVVKKDQYSIDVLAAECV